MTTVKSISQGTLRPYPPGGIATSIDIAHLITVLITYRDLSGRRRRPYVGSGSLPELGLSSACSLALALFCCTLQFVSLTKKLSSSKRSTICRRERNWVETLSSICLWSTFRWLYKRVPQRQRLQLPVERAAIGIEIESCSQVLSDISAIFFSCVCVFKWSFLCWYWTPFSAERESIINIKCCTVKVKQIYKETSARKDMFVLIV